ncbi:MAG: hypothetical protein Q9217_006815, partial [Psora testacea]
SSRSLPQCRSLTPSPIISCVLMPKPCSSSTSSSSFSSSSHVIKGLKRKHPISSSWSFVTLERFDFPEISTMALICPKAGQKAKSETKEKNTPGSVEDKLDRHHMLLDDEAARERNQNFFKDIDTWLDHKRDTPVKPKESANFCKTAKIYKNNEDTYLLNVVPLIIRREYMPSEATRQVIQEQEKQVEQLGGEEQESVNEIKEEMRNFFEDGMSMAANELFIRNLVPKRNKDLEIEASTTDTWGLENSKCDRIVGYLPGEDGHLVTPKKGKFSDETAALCQVVDKVEHPYFILEGKQAGGNTTDMTNKARKGGATLVYIGRKLREQAELETNWSNSDGTGADLDTYVFSATLSAQMFEIYVNWAEKYDGLITFHMHLLHELSVKSKDAQELSKRWAHNVIEWGLWVRRPIINEMRTALIEHRHKKQKTSHSEVVVDVENDGGT